MRILVIEDNSDITANLVDYLEDRGHTVDFAADGVTGLHLAVVHDFDAIVLDVLLPTFSGFEICQRLRELDVTTPILMLTWRDREEDVVRGLRLGAVHGCPSLVKRSPRPPGPPGRTRQPVTGEFLSRDDRSGQGPTLFGNFPRIPQVPGAQGN